MPPPSLSAGTRLLDADLALSQIGDKDALRDLLALLQDTLARDLPHIAALLQAGNVAGANGLLHNLKGIIPIVCQPPFCQEVVRVELLSKPAQNTALADLQAAYAPLALQLEQLLGEIAAWRAAYTA